MTLKKINLAHLFQINNLKEQRATEETKKKNKPNAGKIPKTNKSHIHTYTQT